MSDGEETAAPVLGSDGEDAEALHRLRTLLDAAGDGIVQLDADGRFVAVDDTIVDATGYRRDALVGEHVSAILAASSPATERRLTDPADGSDRLEIAVQTADGDVLRYDAQVDSLGADGAADGTVGILRAVDVTGHGDDSEAAAEHADTEAAAAHGDDSEAAAEHADTETATAHGDGTAATVEHADAEAEDSTGELQRRALDGASEHGTAPEGDGIGATTEPPAGTQPPARERVLTALEAAREGISLLDADGVFVYVNDAYATTFGYEPEEMVGEHWDDLGIEADPEHVYEEILPTVEAEGQWTGTTTCVRSDGSTFQSQHSLTHTENGEFVCLVRDLGDRERRERDLERYETIFQAVNDGVYVVDESGTFTMVNEAYAELLGYEREELLGEHVSTVVDEEVLGRAQEMEASMVDDEADDTALEAGLETADGGQVTAEATFAMLPGGDERYHRVGVVRDVTERRARERTLERYERILENLPVGVYRNTPGPGGEFVEGNARLASIFGADSVDELMEYQVSDLYTDPDQRAAFSRRLEREGTVEDVELRQETLDGETIWISVTAIRTEEDGEVYFDGTVQDITERKRTQQQLAEERDVFAQGPAVVFRWKNEPGWPVEYVSENVEAVLGYTPRELESGDVPYTELLLEGERDRIAREVAEHSDASTDRFSHEPYRVRTSDGDVRWVKDTTTIVRDESGEITHYLGYLVDVTERKERERELEESERRYRTLVENFPNGAVALVDDELRFTAAGGQILEDVGTSQTDIVGQTVWERYPTAVAEELDAKFQSAFEDGTASEFQLEFADRHWRAHTLPVEDADGEIDASMLMLQDVTEQVEREQALEESESQLRALIELLPVAVFVAEADGRIVEWNEAAEEVWGGEVALPDSVDGYDVYDGWWADTGEPLDPEDWALARALRGEEVTDPDVVEIEGFDGERRTVLNHGMPVRDADGEVSRAVVTLTDITERREYQRRLEESNERLEQFAYAASHDLQEPLRMVSSYLQLIEGRYSEELDEDGREYIEFAVDGADRMRDMIDGLLEYSRIDARGSSFAPVDLDAVVDDVREDLQMRIEESDADISVGSLPTVDGDEEQLRQVLQNLLENAIQYSGDAPPRIDVTAEPVGETWAVSVSDDGIGIEGSHTDRVFDIFERLRRSEDDSGAGIGLALCQRIVERHGGELRVESEVGEGSTFTFTLPAAADPDA